MSSARSRALLILGMHRSGTSCVARVCNLLGGALGQNLIPPSPHNPHGYWEEREIVDLDDEVLAALGRRWHDNAPLPEGWLGYPQVGYLQTSLESHLSGLAQHPFWIAKDPRISLLVPFWERVLRSLSAARHAVIVLRHPLDVAASLRRRNDMALPPALALWQRHLLEAERGTRAWSRIVLSYETLVTDWRRVVIDLRETLDLPWNDLTPDLERAIEKAIVPPSRPERSAADLDDAAARSTLPETVQRTYQALRRLSTRDDDDARRTLDGLRSELRTADGWLGATVASLEKQVHLTHRLLPRDEQERVRLWDDFGFFREVGLFDEQWYTTQSPEVRRAGIDPLLHYLLLGRHSGRNPHPLFDVAWYAQQNQDVASSPMDPYRHYLEHGRFEGRDPCPVFAFSSATHAEGSVFTPPRVMDPFDAWQVFNQPTAARERAVRRAISKPAARPTFSVLMPVYDPPLDILDEAIRSVCDQSYQQLELVLVDDASANDAVRACLHKWASHDRRVRVIVRSARGNVSVATNDAADAATGLFFVFVDHDDVLARHALAHLACHLAEHPTDDLIYTDDAKIDQDGRSLTAPKFKPDWSPELLLAFCYTSHVTAVRATLYRELGGCRRGFEGSQDHDLHLRVGERTDRVGHVPTVLYTQHRLPGSTALNGREKPHSFEAGRRAVSDAFQRRGVPCAVVHGESARRDGLGIYSAVMPDDGPEVALVVLPVLGGPSVRRTVHALASTTYVNRQVYVVLTPGCPDGDVGESARMLDLTTVDAAASLATVLNLAAELVRAEHLLFLTDPVEAVTPRWLSQMVGWARLPGVGVVGPRLLGPPDTILDGGRVVGPRGASRAFAGRPRGHTGHLRLAQLPRNASAVSLMGMLVGRHVFDLVQGFKALPGGDTLIDVDFCLRAAAHGLRTVHCADATVTCRPPTTGGETPSDREIVEFRRRYPDLQDPYVNANMVMDRGDIVLRPTVPAIVPAVLPLKTLVVSHSLEPDGAPTSQFEVVAALTRSGLLAPHVISPVDGPLAHDYRELGIEVTVLGSRRPAPGTLGASEGLAEYEHRIAALSDDLGVGAFALVFANTVLSYWAIDLARRAGVPSIWTIRESTPWKHVYHYLPEPVARIALSCFSWPYRVVFVSDRTRDGWQDLNTVGNFTTIKNGLMIERFLAPLQAVSRPDARASLALKEDEVVILSIGTTCARKGQHDLVSALGLLSEKISRRTSLFIVGDIENDYSRALARLVVDLPENRQAKIHVVKRTRDTARYFRAADVFCLCSREESYPRVILEAMAAGLPIITTPVFGVAEQVVAERDALTYPPGAVGDLARQLTKTIESAELRQRLSEHAAVRLQALPNHEEMIAGYARLFGEAVLSHPPSPAELGPR